MLELSISQAQKQFTKIIKTQTLIIDKKSHHKKAVILPYDSYIKLLKKTMTKDTLEVGGFNEFVGVLDKRFKTEDVKYNAIVK